MIFVPEPPPRDFLVEAGVIAITAAVLTSWSVAARKHHGRGWRWVSGAGLTVASLSWAVAASGVLRRFDLVPPPMAVMMVGVLASGLLVGFSPAGRSAAGWPLLTLVGLQAFRLPLELIMQRGAARGILPSELSFGGLNADILTGAFAALIWTAERTGVRVPHGLYWAWNVCGICCLTLLVVVAAASSPMVRAFGDDPRHVNTWVLHWPYVWVPAVLVTSAVTGHTIVTRRLWATGQVRARGAAANSASLAAVSPRRRPPQRDGQR